VARFIFIVFVEVLTFGAGFIIGSLMTVVTAKRVAKSEVHRLLNGR